MEIHKKAALFKYMFVVSTVCGALGVYFLIKHFMVLGWILVGIWAVLGVLVRVLIIKDRKTLNKRS